MALAIVTWRGAHDGSQEFDAQIGSNRYYAWGVGSGTRKQEGVTMLASRSQTSPLLGPLEPTSRGRAVLRVPSDAFTGDHHHLQLLSFRDEELRGPAVSDLVEVPWRWSSPDNRTEEPMSAMSTVVRTTRGARPAPVPSQMSTAQFLDALAGVISRVLPIVRQALPVVEQVGRMLSPTPTAAPGTPAATPAGTSPPAGTPGGSASASPDLGQLIAQLLTQVQRVTAPPGAALPAAAPAAPAGTTAAGGMVSTGSSLSGSLSARGAYSHASIAPLLAALPALAPLLQSVLTPQTVQSLISAADPSKMLQTTITGLMDAARIGQQATDQLHAHLRALNPGLGDDVLVPLLASMSTTASYNDRRRPRHLSRVVRLELPDLAPVELGGYPQVAFQHGEAIALPVNVDTPRAIPRAQLSVCVKDARTIRRVAERTLTFDRLEPGRLPDPVVLPAAVTQRLIPGREYLVTLDLEWAGRNGAMGTTTTQLIRVVGEATFDSLDTGGEPIRLDDVHRDRDWWHKVWAETVDERNRRTSANLDYEFRLLPGAAANRRSQTAVDLNQVTERRAEGTVRAGLGVSLAALSRLAARLLGEPFDEATMQALSEDAFAAAFDRRATCSLSMHGRRNAQLAVWVWPEVKLHTAYLMKPQEVSPETGQVLSFETRAVKVPVPGLAHVLTTRSP